MLVRPLEDRAFQVADIRESSRAQALRHFARAITDSAVSHDRSFFRKTRRGAFRGRIWLDTTRAGQTTHVPFFPCPHIEEDRRGPAFGGQPSGEFAGGNPFHFRKLVPERGLEQKPIDTPQTESRENRD